MENFTELIVPLLNGAKVTVAIFGGSAVIACVMALSVGLARLSKSRILRYLAISYTEFLRGTSALVQLFWVFFALPMLGVELSALWAAIVVLGLNAGAYGAEIVRGAIQSVPRTQYMAAKALNMTEGVIMRRVILPQALVRMIPPFGNVLIELLKNTALASLITVAELTFQGQILRTSTLRTTEIFCLILVLYFLLALFITAGMKLLEKKATHGMDYGGIR